MAPTTSRSTSHPHKTLLIVRQGPAAPKAEGLISDEHRSMGKGPQSLRRRSLTPGRGWISCFSTPGRASRAKAARRSLPNPRGLGHFTLEGYLCFARSSILVDMLLDDEYGAAVSGLGRDVEQHPGFASTHARERSGAYALLSRDEPHLVVAVRLGLLEVVELKLHLLITGGLRTDLGHAPVPFEPDGLAGGRYQLDGRHRGLLSQEAEEDPEGDEGNYGRCRRARQNDSEILEAVKARGSGRSRPLFKRRPLRRLHLGNG